MKTITKTFYVSDSYLESIKSNKDSVFSLKQVDYYKNPIQISWKEPERKIEITESEFDEYIKDFFKPTLRDISPMDKGIEMKDYLKQKLFRSEE